jgi:hypothetical protein
MIGHHVYTVLALAHKKAQMEAGRQAEQTRGSENAQGANRL